MSKRREMDKAKVGIARGYLCCAFMNSIFSPRLRTRLSGTRICWGKQNFSDISLTSGWVDFLNLSRFLFDVLQRARDPEYAALMDAQPKPKGRGRKKATYDLILKE